MKKKIHSSHLYVSVKHKNICKYSQLFQAYFRVEVQTDEVHTRLSLRITGSKGHIFLDVLATL